MRTFEEGDRVVDASDREWHGTIHLLEYNLAYVTWDNNGCDSPTMIREDIFSMLEREDAQ